VVEPLSFTCGGPVVWALPPLPPLPPRQVWKLAMVVAVVVEAAPASVPRLWRTMMWLSSWTVSCFATRCYHRLGGLFAAPLWVSSPSAYFRAFYGACGRGGAHCVRVVAARLLSNFVCRAISSFLAWSRACTRQPHLSPHMLYLFVRVAEVHGDGCLRVRARMLNASGVVCWAPTSARVRSS
jgi:hypothetical protein